MAYPVPRSGWNEFCRRFLDQRRGASITLRSRSTHSTNGSSLHPIARGLLCDLAYVREGSAPELRVVIQRSDMQESFGLANVQNLVLDRPAATSGLCLTAEARDGTQLQMFFSG